MSIIRVEAQPGELIDRIQQQAQELSDQLKQPVQWQHNDRKGWMRPNRDPFGVTKNPVELNAALAGHKIERMPQGNLLVDGYTYPSDEIQLEQQLVNFERGYEFNKGHVDRVRAAQRFLAAEALEPTAEEVAAAAKALRSQGNFRRTVEEGAYEIAKAVKRAGA